MDILCSNQVAAPMPKKKELFLSQKPLVFFLNDTQTFKLQTYKVEFTQHFSIGCQTEFIPYSQP